MSHAGRVHINIPLVHRLVATQFPHWAHLPIKPVEFGGWDNRTFHLGEQMSVRLPSDAEYAPSVEKEQKWLPKLAPLLPFPIPTPLALGNPTEEYPWHWSIYQWLDGEAASKGHINDLSQFATDLAKFLKAIQQVNASNGPHNFYRGSSPLSIYNAEIQQALALLDGKIDTSTASALWNEALASTWQHAPLWFHGDIAVGNLLIKNGKLSAVIDFGSMGVGDPACDLAIAWTLFEGKSRQGFRTSLELDEETWKRGRGWALWKALIVYAELPGTNPTEKEKSKDVIDRVLADYKQER